MIGVAFVIGAVYMAMVLKKLSKTIEDANAIITDNRKAIESIMGEVESITRSSSIVADDVQHTVGSLKKSVGDVEKTVKTSKNLVLSPMLKTVGFAQTALRLVGRKSKNKRK